MSPPAVPYVATVTASGEEATAPAWGAVVRDDTRRWCVNNGVGATLNLTFDRPIAIARVWLYSSYEGAASTMPAKLELVTDAKTVAATNTSTDRIDVALDGAPTKRLTLKVTSLHSPATTRMCLDELAVEAVDGAVVPLLVGVPPDGAAALPAFVRDLDSALAACDVKGIAAAFAFPLAATMHFDVRPADRVAKKPVVMTYRSARELAEACANDGRLLALGHAAAFSDFSSLSAAAPGLVHLGEPELGWRLAWTGSWKVAAADLHDPTFRSDGWGDAPGPVALWIMTIGGARVPNTLETASDALFVALDASAAVIARDRFRDAIGELEDSRIERVTTARAGGAGWMTAVFPGEIRVSALSETVGDTSRVIAAFVSRSHRGKPAAMAALPPLTRDKSLTAHPDVLAAVNKLVSGPIDPVAASRPDLVAIGAGENETTVGGDKLARLWNARWAKQLTVTGVVGRVAASGRTAFVVLDATKGKTAYRLAMVLDQTAAGAWSLGHLHIATP